MFVSARRSAKFKGISRVIRGMRRQGRLFGLALLIGLLGIGIGLGLLFAFVINPHTFVNLDRAVTTQVQASGCCGGAQTAAKPGEIQPPPGIDLLRLLPPDNRYIAAGIVLSPDDAQLNGRLHSLLVSFSAPATAPEPPKRLPPPGLEFLMRPPPERLTTVVLEGENGIAVGVVLPQDIHEGDKVSGTLVPLPGGKDLSVFEGMVIEDPEGKKHAVEPGKLITFVAGAAMAWKLIDKDGETVGGKEITAAKEPAPTAAFPKDPVLVQNNQACNLPGSFDGDASNSKVQTGKPAKVGS